MKDPSLARFPRLMASPTRPTKVDLARAVDRTIPDLIRPGLSVLFCGINPGLYSGATGHHFARPGNRFWPALHRAQFTSHLLNAWEERELLDLGYGITNLVRRTTAAAAELRAEEFRTGRRVLLRKVRHHRPRWIAVLGLGAYRVAFDQPKAGIGPQMERIGDSAIWVLPSPSGLNAHHQLGDLTAMFAELRDSLYRGVASCR